MSEPIITYALLTPGRGLSTFFVKNDSHFPSMLDTSRPVSFTTFAMSDDLPKVPTRMGVEPLNGERLDAVTFARAGFASVTRWMSAAKSAAAI